MSMIKLAYLVATPELRIDETVTAFQGDTREAFRRLRDLGYDGAELMIREPDSVDPARMKRLSQEYGIEIPVICTGEVYGQDYLSFMDPDESVRLEAIRRMKKIIDFASPFGAQVNIGRLRGRFYPEIPRETSLAWMYSAFQDIADYCAARGATLILEPASHIYSNNINSTQEGIEVVRKMGNEHFKLMVDLFHMNLEDKSIEKSFIEAKPYLTHIHICDSNRLAPGRGNLDFKKIMHIIKLIGYRGYISAEIIQFPRQEIALEETITVLRPFLSA